MNFVLVHGAYHGGWCWDYVREALVARGHAVLAPDLPIDDPDSGATEYAAVIREAAGSLPGSVVVAHSMAGIAAPLAASSESIRLVIYLAALLPQPGRSLAEIRTSEPVDSHYELGAADFTDNGNGTFTIGPSTARELFYHDVPEATVEWAVTRLRPQAYRFMQEVTPLEAWPETPAAYVVCRDDHALNPAWSSEAAQRFLGVEPVVIPGGHSPHLARPDELAVLLEDLGAGKSA